MVFGRGHVDAGFDDGRAQQQVVALGDEVAHDALQLALGHLAVGDGNARFGQDFFQLNAAVFDGVHLVVQKVNLPAALEFAQHGFADDAAAFVAHEGLDGQPPLRGGGDHAQVAQALQRHAQGARNRRGREGEHVHFSAQLLHLLLVAHAEAVFLVDDEQAQVLELRFFAQQFVRAHDDVHRAIGHALEGGVDFFGRAKAAHLGHFHGPLGKAVAQGLVVLLGQQRGGGQKGHLLAAGDGHEGRAQGHFGLAKAHVAAHQAVHGLRRNHVLYDGVYGRLLIGRFLKAEVGGELLVVLRAVA